MKDVLKVNKVENDLVACMCCFTPSMSTNFRRSSNFSTTCERIFRHKVFKGSKEWIYPEEFGECVLYHVNLVFGQLSSTVKFRSKICFQTSYEPENWS